MFYLKDRLSDLTRFLLFFIFIFFIRDGQIAGSMAIYHPTIFCWRRKNIL